MIRSWRRRRHTAPAEMNITAFMNLMVILVPFLLITAVFSRVAVLELALPAGEEAAASPQEPLQLRVTVREDRIEIAGLGSSLILDAEGGGYALDNLSGALKRLKARYPDETDAAILLEPDIPYEALVQVMDTVRAFPIVRAGSVEHAELFPDISIGDAPVIQDEPQRNGAKR